MEINNITKQAAIVMPTHALGYDVPSRMRGQKRVWLGGFRLALAPDSAPGRCPV